MIRAVLSIAVLLLANAASAEPLYMHKEGFGKVYCTENIPPTPNSCEFGSSTWECCTGDNQFIFDDISKKRRPNTTIYTKWIRVGRYESIALGVYVADQGGGTNSITSITWNCQTSNDPDTADGAGFDMCSGSTSAGTTTYTCPHTSTYDPGAEHTRAVFIMSDNLLDYFQCSFIGVGAQLADRLAVSVEKRITP